ncbi:hypothetical protein B0T26DRAFT_429785, partial [Lasiosphaeria miniovina]
WPRPHTHPNSISPHTLFFPFSVPFGQKTTPSDPIQSSPNCINWLPRSLIQLTHKMDFSMDIDMNPRKRFRDAQDDDVPIDGCNVDTADGGGRAAKKSRRHLPQLLLSADTPARDPTFSLPHPSPAMSMPMDQDMMDSEPFASSSDSDNSGPTTPASSADDESSSSSDLFFKSVPAAVAHFAPSNPPQPQYQEQPRSSMVISGLNQARRNQAYLRQGYPLSWMPDRP